MVLSEINQRLRMYDVSNQYRPDKNGQIGQVLGASRKKRPTTIVTP
jgi:hypothetical protein